MVPSGGDHIQVVVTAEMLQALLEEAPWAEHAERLLYLSGLLPRVQLLCGARFRLPGFDNAAVMRCWAALGPLSWRCDIADIMLLRVTVEDVRTVIAELVPSVADALFHPRNVGRWSFGTFHFRSEHLAMLA